MDMGTGDGTQEDVGRVRAVRRLQLFYVQRLPERREVDTSRLSSSGTKYAAPTPTA
jgi:hypothetical protein